jgi:signal peptidase
MPRPEVKKNVTHGPEKGPAPKIKEKAGRPAIARPQPEVKAKAAPAAAKGPAAHVKAVEGRPAATAPRPEVKRGGRSLAGRLAGIAASSFLGLTLVTLAFLLLAPRVWDLKFFTVVGGSMEPTIPLGAVVAVRPVDASDIKVNDIIMYGGPQSSSRSASVVHRVVAVEATAEGEPSFVTRGDSNASEDYLMVAAGDVVGRVWFHIPYLGYVRGYGQTQPLFLAMIGLPAMALTGMEIAGLVTESRDKLEECQADEKEADEYFKENKLGK